MASVVWKWLIGAAEDEDVRCIGIERGEKERNKLSSPFSLFFSLSLAAAALLLDDLLSPPRLPLFRPYHPRRDAARALAFPDAFFRF